MYDAIMTIVIICVRCVMIMTIVINCVRCVMIMTIVIICVRCVMIMTIVIICVRCVMIMTIAIICVRCVMIVPIVNPNETARVQKSTLQSQQRNHLLVGGFSLCSVPLVTMARSRNSMNALKTIENCVCKKNLLLQLVIQKTPTIILLSNE